MPTSLIWSAQSRNDVAAIFDYLNSESPAAARSYVDGLTQGCELLRDFPEAGRKYNSRHRLLVFRNHVIFYRLHKQDNRVTITKVVDGRRDYGRLFKNILK